MLLEQVSIRFAHSVITCTEQMRQRFIERGAPGEKIAVILNSFDEERFDPQCYPRTRSLGDPFVLVCHGTVDENYGLDVAIRAVALLRPRIPHLRLESNGHGRHRSSPRAGRRAKGMGRARRFSDRSNCVEAPSPLTAQADCAA